MTFATTRNDGGSRNGATIPADYLYFPRVCGYGRPETISQDWPRDPCDWNKLQPLSDRIYLLLQILGG